VIKTARAGCWLFIRGGRCEYIASLHGIPSVRGDEPNPKEGTSVYADHSGSKEVNLEKQSPTL